MIAQGLTIGISKRELLEDYYPDELPLIFEAWGKIHGVRREEGEEEPERVGVMEFLNL